MIFQNEILISRQNPTIKWVASLQEKKFREKYKAFISEGAKLTFEAADSKLPVTHILLAESKKDLYLDKVVTAFSDEIYKSTELIVISDDAFSKISTEKGAQGIISVIKHLDFFRELDIIYKEEFFLFDDERAVALYSLRDPGNLGAVIRSAVAFGVDHIILSSDSADIYNPKTIRSAMGSLFRVKVTIVKDFSSFIGAAVEKNRRVYAAELTPNAISLDKLDLRKTDIFIIGNEGHGIPEEISQASTDSVYIPICSKTESLNASVAASVLMWEQSKTK